MVDGIQPQEGEADTGGRPTHAFIAGVTLSDLTITQRGFVLAMRKVEEGATTATTHVQVDEMIAETFPPESRFDPDLNAIPTLYRDLRAWLQAHGVVIGVHPKRRILHHLAEYLYDNEEDKQMAHDMARMVLDKQRRMRQADPVPVGEAVPHRVAAIGADHEAPTLRSLTQQLGSTYRHVSTKFSGADGEAFHEYVASYQQAMRTSGASHDQKLELMYHILHGEVKRYYDEQIEGQVATFAEAVHLISEKSTRKSRRYRRGTSWLC